MRFLGHGRLGGSVTAGVALVAAGAAWARLADHGVGVGNDFLVEEAREGLLTCAAQLFFIINRWPLLLLKYLLLVVISLSGLICFSGNSRSLLLRILSTGVFWVERRSLLLAAPRLTREHMLFIDLLLTQERFAASFDGNLGSYLDWQDLGELLIR